MQPLPPQTNSTHTKSPPRWLVWLFVAIAALGFLDATYLTIHHYTAAFLPCSIGHCEVVLTSIYSSVFGIPDALLGAVYYLFVLVALVSYVESDFRKNKSLAWAVYATPIGMLVSVYLFIIQAAVLHAFCEYCLFSATTSTLLFIIGGTIFLRFKNALGSLF